MTDEIINNLVNKIPEPVIAEYSKALMTIGKTINLALEPFRGLIWSYETIKQYSQDEVSKKLENVPPSDIRTPDPIIAGPTIEALKFSANEPSLNDLYTSLLATSMDIKTTMFSHPSFVQIIKQLCSDEIKIMDYLKRAESAPLITLRWFHSLVRNNRKGMTWRYLSDIADKAKCQNTSFFMSYIENLKRLGIIEIPEGVNVEEDENVKNMLKVPNIKQEIEELDKELGKHVAYFKLIKLSEYGTQFINACMIKHELLRETANNKI